MDQKRFFWTKETFWAAWFYSFGDSFTLFILVLYFVYIFLYFLYFCLVFLHVHWKLRNCHQKCNSLWGLLRFCMCFLYFWGAVDEVCSDLHVFFMLFRSCWWGLRGFACVFYTFQELLMRFARICMCFVCFWGAVDDVCADLHVFLMLLRSCWWCLRGFACVFRAFEELLVTFAGICRLFFSFDELWIYYFLNAGGLN